MEGPGVTRRTWEKRVVPGVEQWVSLTQNSARSPTMTGERKKAAFDKSARPARDSAPGPVRSAGAAAGGGGAARRPSQRDENSRRFAQTRRRAEGAGGRELLDDGRAEK